MSNIGSDSELFVNFWFRKAMLLNYFTITNHTIG